MCSVSSDTHLLACMHVRFHAAIWLLASLLASYFLLHLISAREYTRTHCLFIFLLLKYKMLLIN